VDKTHLWKWYSATCAWIAMATQDAWGEKKLMKTMVAICALLWFGHTLWS